MRLDYTLYALAAILLIIALVPFIAPVGMETAETRSIWIIASVVLGLLSIGLGYSQRPKTEAQACQPTMKTFQETMTKTQTAATTEPSKQEKTEARMEKPEIKEALTMATSSVTVELTQVKGIGEKRATQLKALGINSADELAKASAKSVAKKLKISPKIVDKWIGSAKELVK